MHLTLENNSMKFSYCASFQQKLQSLSLLVEWGSKTKCLSWTFILGQWVVSNPRIRTYPYMAVDAFGGCIWSLKVTPGICHRESSLLRPKFHRLSGKPGCAHRLQCCLVFQSPKNALLYSCFPLQSWHILRDQGIYHSITSSCPLPSPPFSSRCCFSPRRDSFWWCRNVAYIFDLCVRLWFRDIWQLVCSMLGKQVAAYSRISLTFISLLPYYLIYAKAAPHPHLHSQGMRTGNDPFFLCYCF